ncbi:odorant receptor 9a [Monomorium pharaonis]|uniref:odorant receptor 9a n=1 Tax=Monomorium pharaonis TaxID=307658 RepID=UPI001745F403|nr:odorant receptor 9a [Monomorium pharaonis]
MTLKATDELDILRKYAIILKRFNVVTMVMFIFFLNLFGLYQFLPDFLDIIAPLNESRDRHFTFVAEYFVDQKKYFYPILTHNLLAVYIGCIAVLSTGTMLMGFILHICAMLKIASYRLEHVNDNTLLVSKSEKDHIIRKRIINAVDIHRRALEFAEFILSSFATLYFIMIGVGISSLTVNMFQFMQLMMFTNDTNGMLACGLLVIGHFIYMFIGNFIGQIVTDHNNNIFNTTYVNNYNYDNTSRDYNLRIL